MTREEFDKLSYEMQERELNKDPHIKGFKETIERLKKSIIEEKEFLNNVKNTLKNTVKVLEKVK